MGARVTERQRDGAIVVVVVTLLFFVFFRSPLFLSPESHALPFGDPSSGPVVVGLAGVAGCSGVFYLNEKATVRDLLEASAVRVDKHVDPDILNRPLATGKTVVVESRERVVIADMGNAYKLMLGIPVDINKVTLEELMLITGIGETTAEHIIEWRERAGGFRKVEDLMKIRGIKEKKFQKLRGYFCTDCMPPH